MKKDFWGWLVS